MRCTCKTASDAPGGLHSPACDAVLEAAEWPMIYAHEPTQRRREREFWERVVLQCRDMHMDDMVQTADALAAEWRKRFGDGK